MIAADISRKELLSRLKSHEDWVVSNRKKGKPADLSNLNLSRIGLGDSILGNVDLSNVNLSNSILRDTNLRRVSLVGANLTYADLSNTNLSASNLKGANLSYANMSRAELLGSDLSHANLSHANLSLAKLTFADMRDVTLLGPELLNIEIFDCLQISQRLIPWLSSHPKFATWYPGLSILQDE